MDTPFSPDVPGGGSFIRSTPSRMPQSISVISPGLIRVRYQLQLDDPSSLNVFIVYLVESRNENRGSQAWQVAAWNSERTPTPCSPRERIHN